MNEREKLAKLIQENSTLPLVFMVSNDEILDDYGWTLHENFSCKVETVYLVAKSCGSGEVYFGKDEALEKAREILADDEKHENLTDEEFEKCVENYIEEKIRHYEAIVIHTEP